MFPPLKGTCIGIYDYTTGPYNVTGGANVELLSSFYRMEVFFILTGYLSCYITLRDYFFTIKGGTSCVPEGRYESEFCRS